MSFRLHSGSITIAALLTAFLAFLASLILGSKNDPQPSAVLSPSPSVTTAPSSTPIPSPTTTPVPTLRPVSPTPKPVSGPPGSGVSTVTVATAKGNFTATIMSFDLSNTRVVTDTASDSDCQTNCPLVPLKDYISRNGGFAGVNGTYFCPAEYPECSSKTNSFDFPVYLTRLSKWINSDKLGWGGRAIVYFDGSGGHYHQSSAGFGGGLSAGIINYPGMLNDSNVQIDDNQSGLSDKQKTRNSKVGIGLRGSQNVMVVLARNVTMLEFAHVFKSLGATHALNLDSGGSTALYYNGYIAGPGRSLPNAIIFIRK